MLIFALFSLFASIAVLGTTLVPQMVERSNQMNKDQAQVLVSKVDRYLREEEIKKMYQLTLLGPIVLGVVGAIFFPEGRKFVGFIVGGVFGYTAPFLCRPSYLCSQTKVQ